MLYWLTEYSSAFVTLYRVFPCTAGFLHAFGDQNGDSRINAVAGINGMAGDDAIYGPIETPIGFACECSWFRKVYVRLFIKNKRCYYNRLNIFFYVSTMYTVLMI